MWQDPLHCTQQRSVRVLAGMAGSQDDGECLENSLGVALSLAKLKICIGYWLHS